MIIKQPLTPEQIKKSKAPSDTDVQKAQDALFMYLLNRVAELEEKIAPPALKVRK